MTIKTEVQNSVQRNGPLLKLPDPAILRTNPNTLEKRRAPLRAVLREKCVKL